MEDCIIYFSTSLICLSVTSFAPVSNAYLQSSSQFFKKALGFELREYIFSIILSFKNSILPILFLIKVIASSLLNFPILNILSLINSFKQELKLTSLCFIEASKTDLKNPWLKYSHIFSESFLFSS